MGLVEILFILALFGIPSYFVFKPSVVTYLKNRELHAIESEKALDKFNELIKNRYAEVLVAEDLKNQIKFLQSLVSEDTYKGYKSRISLALTYQYSANTLYECLMLSEGSKRRLNRQDLAMLKKANTLMDEFYKGTNSLKDDLEVLMKTLPAPTQGG